MKGTLILADAAQGDPNGKVHALGAGWSVTGSPTPPMALILLIDCPWDETNTKHQVIIDLVDSDGRPVSFETGPLGDPRPAIHIEAHIEAGRPPGLPHGAPVRQQMAIGLGPMPLSPGQFYEYRLSIGGKVMDSWLATFFVREAPPAFPA